MELDLSLSLSFVTLCPHLDSASSGTNVDHASSSSDYRTNVNTNQKAIILDIIQTISKKKESQRLCCWKDKTKELGQESTRPIAARMIHH